MPRRDLLPSDALHTRETLWTNHHPAPVRAGKRNDAIEIYPVVKIEELGLTELLWFPDNTFAANAIYLGQNL
jgi:hypothetical protein